MTDETIIPADRAERCGAAATVREIDQQPQVWRRTLSSIASEKALRGFVEAALEVSGIRIVLTGAGTSHFAGRMIAGVLQRTIGARVEAIATTDIVARPSEIFPAREPVFLVSFARSGNSPESVAAAKLTHDLSKSFFHLVLTCNPDGALAKAAVNDAQTHVVTMPKEADDQGFAMTSSLTAMMLAAIGSLAPAIITEGIVDRLCEAAENVIVSANDDIRRQAEKPYERVVYLGSGCLKDLTEEASLKILELTAGKVMAYSDTPLAFRHGPKSLLDDKTLVLVFVSGDPYARRYDQDIITEISAQIGAQNTVALVGDPSEAENAEIWSSPVVANDPDWVRMIVYLVHAQLLGLHRSLAIGLTPDNPFPSGEVNRVVQGVTIHPFDANAAR